MRTRAIVIGCFVVASLCRGAAAADTDFRCTFDKKGWSAKDWMPVRQSSHKRMGGWVQRSDHVENETPAGATPAELLGKKAAEAYSSMLYKKPIEGADDFTAWLDELFDGLGLSSGINMLGASYGSWISAEYALKFPRRVNKIVLLVPAATVVPLGLEFVVRALACLLPGRYFIRKMLDSMAQGIEPTDEVAAALMEDAVELGYVGIRAYKNKKMVPPQVLTDDQLRELEVPALFVFGEKENLYDSQKAVERLAEVVPETETVLMPGVGHMLFVARASQVAQMTTEFILRK